MTVESCDCSDKPQCWEPCGNETKIDLEEKKIDLSEEKFPELSIGALRKPQAC